MSNALVSQNWRDTLKNYSDLRVASPPRITPTAEESMQLLEEHGLRFLPPAPAEEVRIVDAPPCSNIEADINRYLWAIIPENIPYAAEVTQVFGLAKIKHTNLTGAANAFSGGEMWFIDGQSFVFNGSSGRYGPQSEDHLNEICKLFSLMGYRVACTGFDAEANRNRPIFLVGEVEWLEAAI